jgi:hypothetical protein
VHDELHGELAALMALGATKAMTRTSRDVRVSLVAGERNQLKLRSARDFVSHLELVAQNRNQLTYCSAQWPRAGGLPICAGRKSPENRGNPRLRIAQISLDVISMA